MVSSLDIGFFDEAKMSDPADLLLFDIVSEDFWWTTYVEGIRFGDSVEQAYSVTKMKAFTDSGTSCLIVPNDYFNWIIDNLEEYTDKGLTVGYYVACSERTKLPSIWLLYGGYWFEVRQEDFVTESKGNCYICISRSSLDEYWILGSSFMRGYYVTHDYDTLQFGIVPQAGSSKTVPIAGTVPT